MNAEISQEGQIILRLDLVGYQFPEIEDREGDSDWLLVRLHLQHGDEVWERTDPALTTFEVKWLIEWLDEVADSSAVFGSWRHNRLTTRIFFTEPCLWVEVLNGHSLEAPMTLRIYLAAGFLPPFKALCHHASTDEEPDEVWLDFGVDEAQLRAVAARWREGLERFPIRVGLRSTSPSPG